MTPPAGAASTALPAPANASLPRYASATCPNPARPKNLYICEDTIMPRLAVLAILQHDGGHQLRGRKQGRATQSHAQITAPAQAADQIEQLRGPAPSPGAN